jgi:hypothetical protein
MIERTNNADRPVREKWPKRRWYQYSLRSLLVFVVICAVLCGWLGKNIEKKKKERELVEEIAKSGGVVLYDYEKITGAQPSGPAWLRRLLGENFFNAVESVTFGSKQTKVSEAELMSLEELTELQELRLSDTDVTDAGLIHLQGLTKLQILCLGGTRISDDGLERIGELSQLQTLDLQRTGVSDPGVPHLKRLTKLRYLDLTETNVTFDAEIALQKALPNCEIHR